MLYCVQIIFCNIVLITKQIMKIIFPLACIFLSLKILRLISENAEELWKNYLWRKTSDFIKMSRLIAI